jgi:hypothetical protein
VKSKFTSTTEFLKRQKERVSSTLEMVNCIVSNYKKFFIATGSLFAGLAVIGTAVLLYKMWPSGSENPEPTGRGALSHQRDRARNIAAAQVAAPKGQQTQHKATAFLERLRLAEDRADYDGGSSGPDLRTMPEWARRTHEHFTSRGVCDANMELLYGCHDAFDSSILTQSQKDTILGPLTRNLVRLNCNGTSLYGLCIDQHNILTNYHVFQDADPELKPPIQVGLGGTSFTVREYEVKILKQGYDAIVLKIDSEFFSGLPVRTIRGSFAELTDRTALVQVHKFGSQQMVVNSYGPIVEPTKPIEYSGGAKFSMREGMIKGPGVTISGDSALPVVDRFGKIIGIHCAASTAENCISYTMLIPPDLLPRSDAPEPILPQFTYLPDYPHILPDCTWFQGKHTGPNMYVSDKSAFSPSPFYQSSTLEPPSKRPVDLKRQGSSEPMKRALEKIHPAVDTELDSGIEDRIARLLADQIPRATLPAVLTVDQAIYGIPGTSLKPLDLTTSPGAYWTSRGISPKSAVIENHKGELLERISERLSSLKSGSVWYVVFSDFLKDELRDPEKAPRAINNPDMEFTIIWRMFFASLTERLTYGNTDFSAVGINPHGPQWKELLTRMLKKSTKFIAGDVKKFDYSKPAVISRITLKASLLWLNENFHNIAPAKEFINERWKLNVELPTFTCRAAVQAIRVRLWHGSFTFTFHSCNGVLYVLYNVTSSGHPWTTQKNTIDRTGISIVVFSIQVDKPLESFFDLVAFCAFGDDDIESPHPSIQNRYNNIVMRDVMRDVLGMEYTMPDKHSAFVEFHELEDVTFLKRQFVIRTTTVDAPLPLSVLNDSIQYIRKSKVSVKARMTDKVRNQLYELSHFGPEAFEYRSNLLRRLCAVHSISYPTISYGEAQVSRGTALTTAATPLI